MYEGMCFGGPMNRLIAISRFPKGFLLVDKPKGQCWLYDWDDTTSSFTVRSEDPMPVLAEGEDNRFRAAEEPYYDVLAAPWGGE